MRQHTHNRAFTLIEALVYVAILTIVSIGSVSILFDLNNLFYQYQVKRELFESGTATMERIITEVRQAELVDLGNTSIATSTAGKLTLDNGATTTAFRLENNSIIVSVNGTDEGILSTGNLSVDGFTVYRYALTQGELVRIKLELSATIDQSSDSLELYGAAVVRGSYR